MSFVHLHVHTDVSTRDGLPRVDDYVARAAELEQPAVAITDHGSMAAAIKGLGAARKSGGRVKCIVGTEAYVVDTADSIAEARKRGKRSGDVYHLVLLATDLRGYASLCRLYTVGVTEGRYYYHPTFTIDDLNRYNEGLLCLTACVVGALAAPFRRAMRGQGDWNAAEQESRYRLDLLRGVFGDRLYVEIMYHGLVAEQQIMPRLVRLAVDEELPVVMTNDVHILRREQIPAHLALLAIQGRSTIAERAKEYADVYGGHAHMKSREEMEQTLQWAIRDWSPYYPERDLAADLAALRPLETTLEVAERCSELHISAHDRLPRSNLQAPPDFEEWWRATVPLLPRDEALLVYLCQRRLRELGLDRDPRYVERMWQELEVLIHAGFASYLCVVADYVRAARDAGILVGVGRGSAVGSLCLYLLGITRIDPLRFNLMFERFVNQGRTMRRSFALEPLEPLPAALQDNPFVVGGA